MSPKPTTVCFRRLLCNLGDCFSSILFVSEVCSPRYAIQKAIVLSKAQPDLPRIPNPQLTSANKRKRNCQTQQPSLDLYVREKVNESPELLVHHMCTAIELFLLHPSFTPSQYPPPARQVITKPRRRLKFIGFFCKGHNAKSIQCCAKSGRRL